MLRRRLWRPTIRQLAELLVEIPKIVEFLWIAEAERIAQEIETRPSLAPAPHNNWNKVAGKLRAEYNLVASSATMLEATRVLSRLGLSTWRRWLLLSLVVSMVPFGYQVEVRLVVAAPLFVSPWGFAWFAWLLLVPQCRAVPNP